MPLKRALSYLCKNLFITPPRLRLAPSRAHGQNAAFILFHVTHWPRNDLRKRGERASHFFPGVYTDFSPLHGHFLVELRHDASRAARRLAEKGESVNVNKYSRHEFFARISERERESSLFLPHIYSPRQNSRLISPLYTKSSLFFRAAKRAARPYHKGRRTQGETQCGNYVCGGSKIYLTRDHG